MIFISSYLYAIVEIFAYTYCILARPVEQPNLSDQKFAKDFLKTYGYLSRQVESTLAPASSRSRLPQALKVVDDELAAALENYQRLNGLPVTGVFDEATKSLMTAPRCGRSDVGPQALMTGVWDKSHLTYSWEGHDSRSISRADARKAFEDAIRIWAPHVPLTFSEVPENGDIKISFQQKQHAGCVTVFGPRVLAHAFGPDDGDVHVNDETFTWQYSRVESENEDSNLLAVALHELGHSLGLDHNLHDEESIMAPELQKKQVGREIGLHSVDIAAIKALYAHRPNDDVPTTSTTASIRQYNAKWHLKNDQTGQFLANPFCNFCEVRKKDFPCGATYWEFVRIGTEEASVYQLRGTDNDYCLDSDASGKVYVSWCEDGNRNQMWLIQVENQRLVFVNVATERYLDWEKPKRIFTNSVHSNSNEYQYWSQIRDDSSER